MALFNRFLTSATCFAIEYNDVLSLGVTGYELEQINDKFFYFTLYSHPSSFDMARKGMCSKYRGEPRRTK